VAAALADIGVVAVRKALDELVRADGTGGGLHLVVVGVGPAERDVVADRAREQEALLRDDPQLRAQRALRHVSEIVAVHEHASAVRVVEARD
jgi:hypothetical protein